MENVQLLHEIRRIYNEYLAETIRLETAHKPTEGLMGFGRGPGSDVCHDQFSDRLEKALGDITADGPSSQEAFAALRFVYDAPMANKNNQLAYWMLQAVHALTGQLIGFLSPEDAAVLWTQYKELYPRATRLPAQKKIAALLQAKAGDGAQKKRSLLDIIRRRDS